jgi:hypothetical protein
MTLAELRRISIRQHLKIRFRLSDELECVISEDGVARVPALRRVPDFNLEQALLSVNEFTLEPITADKKHPATPRVVSRGELAALISPSSSPTAEHEDE